MAESAARPLVLLHLGWVRDRELVGALLGTAGVDILPTAAPPGLRRLLAEGRLDLVLADTKAGRAPLDDLLETLEAWPEAGDLPPVIPAEADEMADLAELVIRRQNAVLLAKPVDPGQLRAAVAAGLRYRAGRRREHELLRRLSDANAGLRAANAELDRRRAEAEEARRRYQDLVHGTDAIVWEADAGTGRLTFVSRRAEEWFGGPAGRWDSVPDAWLDRVVLDDREYAHGARRRGIAEGRDFELEYRAEAVDGRTIWVHEAARVARDEDGRPLGLRGLVRDITRRKRIERQLYKAKTALAGQLADLEHLHRISAEVSAATGLEAALEQFLRSAMGLVGTELGVVRLRDGEGDAFVVAASVGLPAAYLDRYRRQPVPEATGRPVDEVATLAVPDVEAEADGEPFREAARMGGYRGVLSVPIPSRAGSPMGLLELFFPEPHCPVERQVRLVELYARQAAGVIQAALLHRELREADLHKDAFLAMLAHELRNPLAAIDGAARVASLAGGREETEWALDVIGRQSRHLVRLVDDLLDASRIAQGKIELRPERVDAAAVLRQAAEASRALVEDREHRFEVDLGREPLWVDADPTRLVQMVINLLTNAARYTPARGHIRLGAGRRGDRVLIRVSDSGVGIRPEELPRLFGLFAQGERRPDRAEGGLGIGLALVKALAELHGGRVTASSAGPGLGSEFVVDLPAAGRPDDRPGEGPSRAEGRRASVLVVDDSKDTARGLARLLQIAGHDVRIAHDGPSALRVARGHHPEYVLLDLGLPGMDGYELAARIRRESWGRDAVLVAVSGYGQEDDRRRSREAGIDHHLLKPVDFDALSGLMARGD